MPSRCSPPSKRSRNSRFARLLPGLLLAAAVAGSSGGCAVTDATRSMARSMRNALSIHTSDRRDPTDEVDSWTTEVGMDARGNRPRDVDPDGWWGNYVISDKHREIERSLGVDYE